MVTKIEFEVALKKLISSSREMRSFEKEDSAKGNKILPVYEL